MIYGVSSPAAANSTPGFGEAGDDHCMYKDIYIIFRRCSTVLASWFFEEKWDTSWNHAARIGHDAIQACSEAWALEWLMEMEGVTTIIDSGDASLD